MTRALIFMIPALGLLISGVLIVDFSSSRDDERSTVAAPTVASAESDRQAADPVRPVSTPTAGLPTPAAEVPTPIPAANRADCETIRGTDYESAEERGWFLDNCVATASSTSTLPGAASIAPAVANEGGLIRASGDRLVIDRLGIDAPVNYRTVEDDGILGNPVGAFDVVWYDFSNLRGLGGYPGRRGNAVYAGHVDYYGVGPAVFWNLRNIAKGDIVEVYAADGVYRYAVDWFADYTPEDDWSSIVAWSRSEVITLITCIGTFDPGSGYSNRRVVRASRID